VRPARRGCLPSMNTERINMPTGFLKTYLIDRGFGFIRPGEGGRDTFSTIAISTLTPTISGPATRFNLSWRPAETGDP
jgi:hypothetical protein